MRTNALKTGEFDSLYALAGQSAALARAEPAGEGLRRVWDEARALIA